MTSGLADALRLVYIADAAASADVPRLERVMAGGVSAVWLRDPHVTGAVLFEHARDLVAVCHPLGARVIVGDRVDVAVAAGADGAQLGFRAPPLGALRPGYAGWLGASCHDAAELARAADAGADYAVLAPLFDVPGKGKGLGPDTATRLIEASSIPVVALGGIDEANAGEAIATGACGVAAIRGLRDAADPKAAAAMMRSTE